MNPSESHRLFIITGGPGSGKSTLIEALAARGFACMPEAGRAIIRDQVSIGGEALPWLNRRMFAELMLSWEMRSYRAALDLRGPVFFDRGVPDVAGYLRLSGMSLPAHVEKAAESFRYCPRVFIAPPWLEIFGNDAERLQSFDEAQATHRAMAETYAGLGYDLIPLPQVPVEQRVEFVVKAID
jgi:predicted ATPase